VMRSRAVAEEVLALGGEVLFVVDEAAGARRLEEEGYVALAAIEQPHWAALPCSAAWIDGFSDWTEDLRQLRRQGAWTVLVENRTPAREWTDLLVYPALHHVPDRWDRVHADRVWAEPEVIPLREPVRNALPGLQRDVDLLVTFGGADPKHLTERVLAALPPGLEHVAVSVGVHMEPRRAELERVARESPAQRVDLLPPGADPAPWMARARGAVTALGTTLYELAHLETAALILANYEADRGPLDYYGEHGPHVPLGLAHEFDDSALAAALAEHLPRLAETPRAFPDLAAGAQRLARQLLDGRGLLAA